MQAYKETTLQGHKDTRIQSWARWWEGRKQVDTDKVWNQAHQTEACPKSGLGKLRPPPTRYVRSETPFVRSSDASVFVGKHNFIFCEQRQTAKGNAASAGPHSCTPQHSASKKNRWLAPVTAALNPSPWPTTSPWAPCRRWAHQMSAPMVRKIPGPCLRQPYATIIGCACRSYCLCDCVEDGTYIRAFVRAYALVRTSADAER